MPIQEPGNTSHVPELPSRVLTFAEVEDFEQHGAVVLRGLIAHNWVNEIESAVEYVLSNPSELARATAVLGGGGFSGDAFMWKVHPTFHRFIFESPAAHLARQVMRSNRVAAFYDQIFAKAAGSVQRTPYHEDVSSWPVEGNQVCALWIPLDPCTPTSAALQVVKGSHRWDRTFLPVTPAASHLAVTDYDDATQFADVDLLSWNLDRGDCVLFHPRAIHGATGTSVERGRRAFVSRWVGDDMTFRPRHSVLPLLWEHGLLDGDPISGPLFPEVLPSSEWAPFRVDAPDAILTENLRSALRFL